jgi:PAS domain S-box-containing protein
MKRVRYFLDHISWSLALPLFAALLILHQTSIPGQIDAWIYDALITSFPENPGQDTVVIGIDEQSLVSLGRWPWPRSSHAALVRQLDRAGAETIVFDVLFPETGDDDPELAAAIKTHGQVVLALHLWPPAPGQLMTEVLPTPALRDAAAALGHAHVELDGDGVARGLYLYNGLGDRLWPSLGLAAHEVTQAGTSSVSRVDTGAAAFVNVRRDFVAVPLAGRSGRIPTYSYIEVLESEPAPDLFAGKTVFIGATARGFGEALATPFSGHANPMSGVEFHANAYSATRNDRLIIRADSLVSWWLPGAIILLLAFALPKLYPLRTIALCTAIIATLVLLLTGGLFIARVQVPTAMALLMPMIAFPLWSARRLALTNQFLNHQLEELAQSRQLNLPEAAHQHPIQLIELLRSLLQAEGWYLAEGDQGLTAEKLSAADIPPLPVPGRWSHINTQSWTRLVRNRREYFLGLDFPESANRAAKQRYLDHLALDAPGDLTQPVLVREKIRALIEQVQKATQRMNSMHAFIERTFERMPDGIIVTDALGVIQVTNRHIEEWFGEQRPGLIAVSLAQLLQSHDPRENPPWHETIAETLTLGQSRTVDLRIRGRDFLIHFAPFDLPENRQRGIIANIVDVSELRKQQRQHREAIDFISHDVRSPLVSQLALIAQLKRRPHGIQPEELDHLERLARRSYKLAEEFVQLARAEQLTETRLYECEFLAIVENARDSVSEQATGKGIGIQLEGSTDVWVNGNAELLERAVINLLTNAVQYSAPDSTITIQVFQAGHQVCLSITDEGSGIAASELPYLFERFSRQRSSELSGNQGAGLGLSFVNVVVTKHRGEISVESTENVGSTFMIKLPLANPI